MLYILTSLLIKRSEFSTPEVYKVRLDKYITRVLYNFFKYNPKSPKLFGKK